MKKKFSTPARLTLFVLLQKASRANSVSNRKFPIGLDLIIWYDCDNFHNIGYLPAINQSPTSHDTVLELLSQSKLKAEKLGLTETDVLNMAIYAKAVEIIMNPRYVDLKKFIVLRLGAFHTLCIFIAVIGKRFGDAGLRDIIVESSLLGESSVDQMFRGKHYNNAMRVLKYLYDAMKRHMIESYEQSVHNGHLEKSYKDFIESAGLQKLISSPSKESLETFRDDHQDVISHIHAYENSLLAGSLGPTASIWSSFLKMVQILLDFARSIKLGGNCIFNQLRTCCRGCLPTIDLSSFYEEIARNASVHPPTV